MLIRKIEEKHLKTVKFDQIFQVEASLGEISKQKVQVYLRVHKIEMKAIKMVKNWKRWRKM